MCVCIVYSSLSYVTKEKLSHFRLVMLERLLLTSDITHHFGVFLPAIRALSFVVHIFPALLAKELSTAFISMLHGIYSNLQADHALQGVNRLSDEVVLEILL